MAVSIHAHSSARVAGGMRQPRRGRCSWVLAVCSKVALLAGAVALLAPQTPSSAMCAAPPAPPKKAMNAYMFFTGDRRAKLSKENPDMPVTEIAKLMGEEWREMTTKAMKPYTTKAEKDKKRYEKELAAYTKKYGEPPKRQRKAKKDSTPKKRRAPSAYNMYVKDQMTSVMAETGITKVTEAMGELSKKWKGMTAKQQEKYKKQAAAAAAELEDEE